MSKLDELIQELCPDGVEYKKIGEVCTTITDYTAAGSFADIAKNVQYINNGTGYAQLIRTTDLKSNFSKTDSFVYINEHAFNYLWRVNLNSEGLVMPNVGNCGEVYYITPDIFLSEHNVLGPNAIWIKSDVALNRFLYHVFLNGKFQGKLAKIISPTGQTKFNKTNFKELTIPIPPLEVQREIVRILDNFTELAAELAAELTARKKQYEYYRDRLFELIEKLCPDGVEYKRLSEVATIERGKRVVKEQLSKETGFPVFQNSLTSMGYHKDGNYPAETSFVIGAGAAGEIGYSKETFWAADDCFPVVCGTSIISRYVFHFLLWKQPLLLSKVRKASIPRLSRNVIENLIIPVPPLEVQREIVRILDNFTELTAELTAELAARKKQYEYYRDKLLTFKMAENQSGREAI